MCEAQPEGRDAYRADGLCAKATIGGGLVVEDGMDAKADHVKQGDLPGEGTA